MGRLATPQEVSDGIVFLSSERSSYITGTELKVRKDAVLKWKTCTDHLFRLMVDIVFIDFYK
jgi:hypothetical protein